MYPGLTWMVMLFLVLTSSIISKMSYVVSVVPAYYCLQFQGKLELIRKGNVVKPLDWGRYGDYLKVCGWDSESIGAGAGKATSGGRSAPTCRHRGRREEGEETHLSMLLPNTLLSLSFCRLRYSCFHCKWFVERKLWVKTSGRGTL